MPYYKVNLKGGHVGSGKSYDFVRFFEATDMMSAFLTAMSLSRVKKNPNGTGITSIEPVSGWEFHQGLQRERTDPYLRRRG
jgi:hypothetical protein